MKIKLKREGILGPKRLSFDLKVDRIEKNTNPVVPSESGATIFIRGVGGTGVVVLSSNEVEALWKKITESRGMEDKIDKVRFKIKKLSKR
ncbi:MAG: hypothetical protein Q7S74_01435 [Nanoarchaeota archaeon]|nr:hypothetical protein [Nanoarchaeota archaeon]